LTVSVEVQSLSKLIPQKTLLRDVNFSVEESEVFVIIGPNGAGKTTLIRLLDLLDKPSKGRIKFANTEIKGYSPENLVKWRRKFGMVFQRTVLFNAKVYDNVAYGLKIRGTDNKTIEKKVKTVLKLVRLSGFEQRHVHTLSGGEAQRVALAQALVIEPELLLLDEPTANLDPANAMLIEEVILNIARERKATVIMTTHNMFQAKRLADKVALLLDGELIETDTPEIFFNQPKDPRTLAFIEGKIFF